MEAMCNVIIGDFIVERSNMTTVTIRGVDLEVWKKFQKKIIDIYGNIYGNLGREMTKALELWLEKTNKTTEVFPIPEVIAIIAKDNSHIMARYRDATGNGKIIEIRGSKSGIGGFEVLLDGYGTTGAQVCRLLGLNPGGDAATRYLRRYLDKIADNEGVEIKEPPYPWDENYV